MRQIRSEEDLQKAISGHPGERIVIFKHSTTCPISAAANNEVTKFEGSASAPVYKIHVIEDRPTSLLFADRCHVTHQSPQAIVLQDGQVQWHASHWDVTKAALERAVGGN